MYKPRVVFPFVEAGFGHIMTERSIADAFEEKYGDKCEVIRTDFYKEPQIKAMLEFEERLCDEVKKYNKVNLYGYASIAAMNIFGTKIDSWFIMEKLVKGAFEASVKYMEELKPDLVLSTHWATNYTAMHVKNRPLTAVYGPDAHLNALFRYDCDLTMISIPSGYYRARKYFKNRYNDDNLKLVPTAIRKEAYSIDRDKVALRKKLGLDDKFTVLLTEGGYGIGLTETLCEMLAEEDLPINLIAICGKNPEMVAKLEKIPTKEKITFIPKGFTENILEYIACSDLYLGKSGNGVSEPAFFGVPTIVTHTANTIEKLIADHYVNQVGSAKKIFSADKCVKFIKGAMNGSQEYIDMKNCYGKLQKFGGEGSADEIYKLLKSKFELE